MASTTTWSALNLETIPGGPGRLPSGASECTQGEEVEEGDCGEPAIGLEYRAVEKFHDIIRAIQVIFKQAGAELCQAQVKLRLSKLDSKFC